MGDSKSVEKQLIVCYWENMTKTLACLKRTKWDFPWSWSGMTLTKIMPKVKCKKWEQGLVLDPVMFMCKWFFSALLQIFMHFRICNHVLSLGSQQVFYLILNMTLVTFQFKKWSYIYTSKRKMKRSGLNWTQFLQS